MECDSNCAVCRMNDMLEQCSPKGTKRSYGVAYGLDLSADCLKDCEAVFEK